MKRLTLLRHAKSERDSLTGRDIDRQLAERGRNDAARVGEEMRRLGLEYDLALSSPASRARQTVELTGFPARSDERIYDASTDQLLAIVQETGDSVERLMLVGHNPGFEQLAARLTGEVGDVPTGSLVEIELPIDHWRDAGAERGKLVRFLKPKELN